MIEERPLPESLERAFQAIERPSSLYSYKKPAQTLDTVIDCAKEVSHA
jgi:hypothetical protein